MLKSKKAMKGEKCTDIEKEARINAVLRKIISGARRFDLLQYFSNEWEVSTRTIDAYTAEAKILLREMSKDKLDIQEEFGLAVMQLSDLYQKAVQAKEYNIARMIRRDLSDLTGIRTIEVIESTEKMDTHNVIKELEKLGVKLPSNTHGNA